MAAPRRNLCIYIGTHNKIRYYSNPSVTDEQLLCIVLLLRIYARNGDRVNSDCYSRRE